jgi:hypothetical protein
VNESRQMQLLAIEDAYEDLMQGFEMWKRLKNADLAGDDYDEAFMRWVEAGDHPR